MVSGPFAWWAVVLYTEKMDQETKQKIRELAEKNSIAPDELMRIREEDGLPEPLREVVTAVLGDIAVFSRALDELDP